MDDLTLKSRRVVTRAGVHPAAIHVRHGKIQAIGAFEVPSNGHTLDVGDAVVMPGLVDSHVHINEPGRTEWEGFVTATRAAAAGGITTVVDMPLNCIPVTTSLAALETKRREAKGKVAVDVGFWGGVVPGNAPEIEPMIAAGVTGFKCFMVHSGIDDFPAVSEADLREALPILARHGTQLIVHAESPGPIENAEKESKGLDPTSYRTFLASRPPQSEIEAISLLVKLAREFDAKIHVVHLSAAGAVPMIEEARAAGVKITAETCPHYLIFTAEEIAAGRTQFKCCPPIREEENREALWRALFRGAIDMIVSDHSPCTPSLKKLETGNFMEAWGGIASLQLGLSTIWTAARERGASIEDLARWMCAAPARLAGLDDRKGEISAGKDADFVVWNPDASFAIEHVHHRHALTPYRGRDVHGVVERVFLRGEAIFDHGAFADPPRGELLARTPL